MMLPRHAAYNGVARPRQWYKMSVHTMVIERCIGETIKSEGDLKRIHQTLL